MNIFQKLLKKLQLKFFPNKIQKEVKRWYGDGGDYKLRFNYCLDNKSVVFDLGGYEGQYASDLFSRMPCNIYIFEPVIEYAKAIEDRYKNNKMIKSFPFGLSDKNQKIKIAKIGDASSVFRSNSSKNLQSIILKDIVDSRDFRIELRKQLLEAPRKAENTRYYLNMNAITVDQSGEVAFTAIFSINADAPDIMTGLFKELVEGEMDDEDNLTVVFNRVLAQFVNSRKPAFMQTNESVVKNWKDYLRL